MDEQEPRPQDEQEWVAEDDAVIGRAFRWSLIAIVAVAVIVVGAIVLFRGMGEEPEDREIETSAPVAVSQDVEPPTALFHDVTAPSRSIVKIASGEHRMT